MKSSVDVKFQSLELNVPPGLEAAVVDSMY